MRKVRNHRACNNPALMFARGFEKMVEQSTHNRSRFDEIAEKPVKQFEAKSDGFAGFYVVFLQQLLFLK
jgi:hypothetical protein